MNRSMPGLPVQHQLPELAQTHVLRVSDAIQPSHRLSYPSPPALNPSQHQSLFQWVSSLHQEAKVLEFQLQHQSFQRHPGLISFRMDWLDLLAVQGVLKSSPAPQFKNISSWVLSLLYGLIFRGNIFMSLESWNENLIIQELVFPLKIYLEFFLSFFFFFLWRSRLCLSFLSYVRDSAHKSSNIGQEKEHLIHLASEVQVTNHWD